MVAEALEGTLRSAGLEPEDVESIPSWPTSTTGGTA